MLQLEGMMLEPTVELKSGQENDKAMGLFGLAWFLGSFCWCSRSGFRKWHYRAGQNQNLGQLSGTDFHLKGLNNPGFIV